MRRGGVAIAVALALLACASAANASTPSPAVAHLRTLIAKLSQRSAVGGGRSGGPVEASLGLTTKSGYRVQVAGEGETVKVVVHRGKGLAATAYVVRGTVTRGRLQASFGDLGAISMRFRPSANRSWVKPNRTCRGEDRFQQRRGVYVGRFHFRGEGRYLAIDARRIKGSVREVAPQCRRRARVAAMARRAGGEFSTDVGENAEWTYLRAYWRRGVSATSFAAVNLRHGATYYTADTVTARGAMAIVRSAVAEGDAAAFTASNALTRARVAPRGPFHGAGQYRAAADGTKTWQGPLVVDFPGLRNFPLTGSPYKVELDRTGDPFLILFLLLS